MGYCTNILPNKLVVLRSEIRILITYTMQIKYICSLSYFSFKYKYEPFPLENRVIHICTKFPHHTSRIQFFPQSLYTQPIEIQNVRDVLLPQAIEPSYVLMLKHIGSSFSVTNWFGTIFPYILIQLFPYIVIFHGFASAVQSKALRLHYIPILSIVFLIISSFFAKGIYIYMDFPKKMEYSFKPFCS